MRDPKTPMAGGIVVAIATFAGAILGAYQGQPSAGLLLGLAIGAAAAAVIWLVDRA